MATAAADTVRAVLSSGSVGATRFGHVPKPRFATRLDRARRGSQSGRRSRRPTFLSLSSARVDSCAPSSHRPVASLQCRFTNSPRGRAVFSISSGRRSDPPPSNRSRSPQLCRLVFHGHQPTLPTLPTSLLTSPSAYCAYPSLLPHPACSLQNRRRWRESDSRAGEIRVRVIAAFPTLVLYHLGCAVVLVVPTALPPPPPTVWSNTRTRARTHTHTRPTPHIVAATRH